MGGLIVKHYFNKDLVGKLKSSPASEFMSFKGLEYIEYISGDVKKFDQRININLWQIQVKDVAIHYRLYMHLEGRSM